MVPHSSTHAWKIPWMEEPGRLQSIGSSRPQALSRSVACPVSPTPQTALTGLRCVVSHVIWPTECEWTSELYHLAHKEKDAPCH